MIDPESPIAFPVHVRNLPAKGMPVTIEADEDQRAALAAAHGLEAVERLTAELLVTPWKRDGVRVKGRIKADVVQACIVTLEPVKGRVDEEVTGLFVPEGSKLARPDLIEGGEMLLDAEGEDAPEPFAGDTVDVGHLAEEFFVLGIDPYPRKPGVAATGLDERDEEERGPLFEQLKALKRQ